MEGHEPFRRGAENALGGDVNGRSANRRAQTQGKARLIPRMLYDEIAQPLSLRVKLSRGSVKLLAVRRKSGSSQSKESADTKSERNRDEGRLTHSH